MKRKIFKSFFLFMLCLFCISSTAFGASVDFHSTGKNILQYGPDGGITFTVYASLKSVLTYNNSGPVYTYSNSDSSISSDSDYGLTACSDTLNVRNSTKFGDYSTASLIQRSSYIVPTGTTIFGMNSGSGWASSTVSYFNLNINNEGYVLPAADACFGGGTITDSWYVQH